MKDNTSPKRILLKLSGEMLKGPQDFGIHAESCQKLARTIQALHQQNIQLGIVIGGGNIFRGVQSRDLGIDRTPADHLGMLSTVMNGIAFQQTLISIGCKARVMSALDCPKVVESYRWDRAMECLDKGEVLIFVGGTGNPFFTTDTAAALRASEIRARLLLKATKVDGVYNQDPLKFPNAKKYQKISYSQFLAEKLGVMDATSIAMCRQHEIPIFVFHMNQLVPEKVSSLLSLQNGTLIDNGG